MNIISLTKRTCTLLLAASLGFGGTTASAGTIYSDIYVFGDSLSDTGNVRDSLGFLGGILGNTIGYGGNGRFSNGDVWHEYLSADLNLSSSANSLDGGNNYSYGGALATGGDGLTGAVALGMDVQIDNYVNSLGGSSATSDALYITWVGGNDVRSYVGQTNPLAALEQTLDSMIASLSQLLDSGVTSLLVPNLPDLGAIPEFASGNSSAKATDLTMAWNSGLETRLLDLSEEYIAELYYFDVFTTFNELLDAPADFGFSNTSDECRSTSFFGERACNNADEYVFWDEIHPTTAAHRVLANEAFEQLANNQFLVSSPATAVLLLLSLLYICAKRRKVCSK
ncbi:SGNH/GDSL hydrolase family protein [Alteromonas genovensis]|uniref:SGNH/GDSL hydrolase family protein n=1 Tax=Alteromonas genovensis TaxID=471225 RepID=UPI002FE30747